MGRTTAEEGHGGQVPDAQALPQHGEVAGLRTDGRVDARRALRPLQYMRDFATKLSESGELVSAEGLADEGMWVRFDGEGRPPVTDGPFAETKDLIAGWMLVDVDSRERAVELAGELSAAPGPGGEPICEWLELRPVLGAPPTITD